MLGIIFTVLTLQTPLTGTYMAVPAGTYRVGKATYLENPLRMVKLGPYQISKYDVTNSEFEAFVKATGYVTDAERLHNAMIFEPPLKEFRWIHDRTASWRYPNGVSRGGIRHKMDHPVTSI